MELNAHLPARMQSHLMLSGALALISTEMGGTKSVSAWRRGMLDGRIQCLRWGR